MDSRIRKQGANHIHLVRSQSFFNKKKIRLDNRKMEEKAKRKKNKKQLSREREREIREIGPS